MSDIAKHVLCMWLIMAVVHGAKDYTDYKVFRIMEWEKDVLQYWMNEFYTHGFAQQLTATELLVSPEEFTDSFGMLERHQVAFEIWIDNVQTLIDENFKKDVADPNAETFQLDKYHTYKQINQHISDITAKYGMKTKQMLIGKSFEGRDMKVLKVGTSKNSPAVWIDCGMYGNAWISPATCLYLIHKLTSGDALANKLIKKIDFYILPLLNPDGYEYTWTEDRMWHKTRSNCDNGECKGADLNRNFGFQWNGTVNSNPCSPFYPGPKPFSEIEAANVRDAMINIKDRLQLYISFHAYGQQLLMPWAYTEDEPEDGVVAGELIKKTVLDGYANYGIPYSWGHVAKELYIINGTSTDWVKGELGVKFPFTVQLPDNGQYGYFLPAREITKVASDIWQMLKELIVVVK